MRTAITVAVLLVTLTAAVSAATSRSPVQVNRCEPRNRITTTSGYVPGYYPYGGRYYWRDVYGRNYYQPPFPSTTHESPTLSIDFVNSTSKSMKTIDFGLVARGALVAEVRDVGEFSPGTKIKHEFGLDPNVFPLGTGLPQCVPLRIEFADGSSWQNPHLPKLMESVHGE
jgi:hypothetical protein